MKQSRNKCSLYNAAAAVSLTLVNGLLGIVVTRFVLSKFGSDFNGINSTANQIVNVLLILEGGFTLASNVALFSPLSAEDYKIVNGVLSATRNKFRRIGILFIIIGIFAAISYALAANSSLPREFIATVIVMAVVPQGFNLFYATTYRVLLQTQQKEYIISLITMCTVGTGHIANIVMILLGGKMWMVRFNTMIFAIMSSILIVAYVKRKNAFINFKEPPQPDLIRGTGDVMAQKITGVIYDSAPIVFLSISPTGGTMLASVYAVYNNVFIMLKSLLRSLIDAPRLSFGQMLTERKRNEVWEVFAQYEYAVFMAMFALLSTAYVLILPFIGIYTSGITDTKYYDSVISLFMVLIAVFEMLHIPSGHLINMAGEFRVSRNFQVISCIVLLICMTIGGMTYGVYGMLCAILLVAILLAVLEIGYIHTKFFEDKLKELLKLIIPLMVCGVLLCFAEASLKVNVSGYLKFLLFGILFLVVNSIAACIVGFIFNRKVFMSLANRGSGIVKKILRR